MTTAVRFPLLPLVVSVAIAAMPGSADAGKPAGGGGGTKCPAAGSVSTGRDCIIPVTTTIRDVDANGLPADIASDGFGPYSHGANGVISWLTDNGYNRVDWDWQFDTYASTARLVNHSLDPEDAVQPGDPHYTAPANPPFWGALPLTSRVTVKCTLVYNNMLTMTAGSSFTCPLMNKFNVAGIDYALSPAQSFNHFPEVTDAQVRCNTANAGGCNDWSITPIGLGRAVARLVPEGGASNDGDFYLRFHIHITRP
ncbi:MAG TPA: hypothetical protein VFF17_13135 [Thermoanaerobaculia bacterium]|nr:hypothetical protein [Thermoanaerobaculia bacterium]